MNIPYLEKVFVSDQAKADIVEIWAYISADSEFYADKTIDEIVLRFALIGNFPLMGSQRDELIFGLRLFPFKNYNIFYFPSEEGVEIYRVLHSSRDHVQLLEGTIDIDEDQ